MTEEVRVVEQFSARSCKLLEQQASREGVSVAVLIRRLVFMLLEREPDTLPESVGGQSIREFHLPPGAAEGLQGLADRLGVSRGAVCRAAVDAGIAEIQALAFPDRKSALEKMGMTDEDLVFQVAEDRPKQLHPGFQAAIAEQLQFDGDIPELRTGPMPEGSTPAVPVLTSARNPVMVGAQLAGARDKVSGELASAEEGTTEVSAYKAGSRSPMLPVDDSTSIVALGPEKASKLAFTALTSSQGRRSLSPVIEDLLMEGLRRGGVDVDYLHGEPDETLTWDSFHPSGSGDYNPRFSIVDVAAAYFKAKILKVWDGKSRVLLRLEPYAKVPKRRFGWAVGFSIDTKQGL